MSTMRQRSTPSRSNTPPPERTPSFEDLDDQKGRSPTRQPLKGKRNAFLGIAEGTGRLLRVGGFLYVILVLGNRLGRLLSLRGGGFQNPLRRGLRSHLTAMALHDWSSKTIANSTVYESTELTRSAQTYPRCQDYGDAYYNPNAIGSDQAYEFILSQAPEGSTIVEIGAALRRSACFALQWMVERRAYDLKMDIGIEQNPARDRRKRLKEDQWSFGKKYRTAFDGFVGHMFDAGVLNRLNRASHGSTIANDLLTSYDDNSLFYVYVDMPLKQEEAKDRLCKWLGKIQQGGWIGGNNYRIDAVDGALLDVFSEEVYAHIRFLGPYWLVKKQYAEPTEGCGGPPRPPMIAEAAQPVEQQQPQEAAAPEEPKPQVQAAPEPEAPKAVKPDLPPEPKGPPATIYFATHHKTGTALSRHVGQLLESKGLAVFAADNTDESDLLKRGSGEAMTCPGTFTKPEIRSHIHWPQWLIGKLWNDCVGPFWNNWPADSSAINTLSQCIAGKEDIWLRKLRTATCGKNYKVIHFVRDPVELMLSSYRYTQLGKEGWMHEPVEDHPKFKSEYCKSMSCSGLTIKEAVEQLPVEEGIILEMNLVSMEIVKQMVVATVVSQLDPDHHITVNLSEIMESSKSFQNTWTRILKGIFPKKNEKSLKGILKALQVFDMNANKAAGASHSTQQYATKEKTKTQTKNLMKDERVAQMVNDPLIQEMMM